MSFLRALILAVVISAAARSALAEQGSLGTNTTPAFSEKSVIEGWGWIVAQQENAAAIEISPSECESFLKGFNAGVHGESSPADLLKAGPDLERLEKARREKRVRAVEQHNESVARKFFDRLGTNLLALPGGVRCEILKPGGGPLPKPRQTVNIHYTGRLIDGTEFSQMGPLDLVLVTNRMPVRGWFEGLQKIHEGGSVKLYVPPPLPEAEAMKWGVEPGSAMIFEIELLFVRDSTEQEIADALVPPAPEPELPASGYSESQLFETWGWSIAQKTRAARFDLNEDQLRALERGIESGVRGERNAIDWETIAPVVEKFVNDHRAEARQQERRKREAENEALFSGLSGNTNVVRLPDGLCYEILQRGSGPFPRVNQFVKVNYTGRLIDGRVFDQTDPALGPLDIRIGTVIAGWNEGVQKINRGGKIKLYIPPSLGYGDVATGGIPPDSALIFEIELLDIRDKLGE
jgi:FKBP-type peptidyl-prolyl cis-trans isomerase